ncbi:hypothetical protein Ga0100231_010380 [Opitutaceae bacterium TAV4]|nr:hypothetical protein Ga0100231_010380 [Opitutaceae bacterium TAV4]
MVRQSGGIRAAALFLDCPTGGGGGFGGGGGGGGGGCFALRWQLQAARKPSILKPDHHCNSRPKHFLQTPWPDDTTIPPDAIPGTRPKSFCSFSFWS